MLLRMVLYDLATFTRSVRDGRDGLHPLQMLRTPGQIQEAILLLPISISCIASPYPLLDMFQRTEARLIMLRPRMMRVFRLGDPL
jgi:hypothetical protein